MTEVIPNTIHDGGKEYISDKLCINGRAVTDMVSENPSDLHVRGVEFFERPVTDIAEEQNGFRTNAFPNTEFAVYRDQTEKLVMFFGESWCYGGRIRDMVTGIPSTESNTSVGKGITKPVGPQLAKLLNSDLYQSCWPGDHTTNMFNKAERMIPQWKDKYDKIKVCIQITDPHRCANACHIYDTEFLKAHTNPFKQDINITMERWLYMYDRSFLVWADEIMQKYSNVEIVLWKNFNPWCLSKTKRDRFKCGSVDLDWTTFNAQLDGVDLIEGRQISNPAVFLRHENNIIIDWCKSTPREWEMHQVDCIEDVQSYWRDKSHLRLGMNINYPSEVSHRLWSMQLAKAGGWV